MTNLFVSIRIKNNIDVICFAISDGNYIDISFEEAIQLLLILARNKRKISIYIEKKTGDLITIGDSHKVADII